MRKADSRAVWHMVTHMNPLEVTFAVISILSLGVSVYAWRDAHIDSAVLSAAKLNGPRRAIADNNIHQEQLRFGISLVMVCTSWSFLFLSPPPPEYSLLPQSLVGLGAWILVSMMVGMSSLIDKSIRKKLQKVAPIEVQTQSRVISPDSSAAHSSSPNVAEELMRRVEAVRDEAEHDSQIGRRKDDHHT